MIVKKNLKSKKHFYLSLLIAVFSLKTVALYQQRDITDFQQQPIEFFTIF